MSRDPYSLLAWIFPSAAREVSCSNHPKLCGKAGARGVTGNRRGRGVCVWVCVGGCWRDYENGHLFDVLRYNCTGRHRKCAHSSQSQPHWAHAASDAASAESQHVHKQTLLTICPHRPRVLPVSGSQILRVNISSDWSTASLNDLCATASSCRGNSNVAVTLHSIQEGLSNQIN